jgi:hypothetical protein
MSARKWQRLMVTRLQPGVKQSLVREAFSNVSRHRRKPLKQIFVAVESKQPADPAWW